MLDMLLMFVADIGGIATNLTGIRPSTSLALSRKIALVQQARVASAAALSPPASTGNILQPSTSTSETASTLIRQVSLGAVPQKVPSREREHMIKRCVSFSGLPFPHDINKMLPTKKTMNPFFFFVSVMMSHQKIFAQIRVSWCARQIPCQWRSPDTSSSWTCVFKPSSEAFVVSLFLLFFFSYVFAITTSTVTTSMSSIYITFTHCIKPPINSKI